MTGSGPQGAELERLRRLVEERTADLQRVKAEYDNYRKRVRRDRLAVREIAVSGAGGAGGRGEVLILAWG